MSVFEIAAKALNELRIYSRVHGVLTDYDRKKIMEHCSEIADALVEIEGLQEALNNAECRAGDTVAEKSERPANYVWFTHNGRGIPKFPSDVYVFCIWKRDGYCYTVERESMSGHTWGWCAMPPMAFDVVEWGYSKT